MIKRKTYNFQTVQTNGLFLPRSHNIRVRFK